MLPTNLQKDAVNKLLTAYNNKIHKIVEFKAPTGSGKTLMATYFISQLLENNLDKKFIFVIATPSQAALPEAFANKINLYKNSLPYTNFSCEYIESPSSSKNTKVERTPSIRVETNKVYIFGKATFGKGRIYTEMEVVNNFIDEIISTNHELIYIRDEAHIGDIKNDGNEKEFEELIQSKASFIIKMTATPKFTYDSELIELKEKDLNDRSLNEGKYLLKSNSNIMITANIDEDDLFNNAISEFKAIKYEYLNNLYEEHNILIKPALLIQVSDEPTDHYQKKIFFNELEKIKATLNANNLSWVKYFGKNDTETSSLKKDFTLEEIARNDSDIDCIIFKVGPATGWDIPRACMLLQLRKVCSDKLTIQTLGRIKRNPMPNLVFNEITNKFYLYSNNPSNTKDINYYKYELKEPFLDEEFPIIEITNKSSINKSIFNENKNKEIKKFLVANKENIIRDLEELFDYDKENESFYFKKISSLVNNKFIYRRISNVFSLCYEFELLKNSKEKYYKYLSESINELYNDIYFKIDLELKGKRIKIKKVYLEYLLLNSFFPYFNKLVKLIFDSMEYCPKYRVKFVKYDPKAFKEIDYTKGFIEGYLDNEKYKNTYLFDTIKNDCINDKDIIILDSKPEEITYKYITEKILELATNNIKVKLWGKNFKQSSVKGEYLDSEFSVHKSYWDFIVKFSNNISLYIEVKSTNDINPNKTSLLKDAYKSYFNNSLKDMFAQAKEEIEPFIISLWYVDTTRNTNQITVENFYDKDIFSDLDSSNPTQLFKNIINFESKK